MNRAIARAAPERDSPRGRAPVRPALPGLALPPSRSISSPILASPAAHEAPGTEPRRLGISSLSSPGNPLSRSLASLFRSKAEITSLSRLAREGIRSVNVVDVAQLEEIVIE